jgi:hypothetical protein
MTPFVLLRLAVAIWAVGDLGNIIADSSGVASGVIEDKQVSDRRHFYRHWAVIFINARAVWAGQA